MGAWAGDRVSIGFARTQSVNSKPIAALGASEAKRRLVCTADLYAKRSEGPQSALRVEICMVQQSDRSLSHYCHSRSIADAH
jgi:hypothetical protein